jgi:hypothetical protein
MRDVHNGDVCIAALLAFGPLERSQAIWRWLGHLAPTRTSYHVENRNKRGRNRPFPLFGDSC